VTKVPIRFLVSVAWKREEEKGVVFSGAVQPLTLQAALRIPRPWIKARRFSNRFIGPPPEEGKKKKKRRRG
jgi:hypothetical protein